MEIALELETMTLHPHAIAYLKQTATQSQIPIDVVTLDQHSKNRQSVLDPAELIYQLSYQVDNNQLNFRITLCVSTNSIDERSELKLQQLIHHLTNKIFIYLSFHKMTRDSLESLALNTVTQQSFWTLFHSETVNGWLDKTLLNLVQNDTSILVPPAFFTQVTAQMDIHASEQFIKVLILATLHAYSLGNELYIICNTQNQNTQTFIEPLNAKIIQKSGLTLDHLQNLENKQLILLMRPCKPRHAIVVILFKDLNQALKALQEAFAKIREAIRLKESWNIEQIVE